jgi:hypothetical protein
MTHTNPLFAVPNARQLADEYLALSLEAELRLESLGVVTSRIDGHGETVWSLVCTPAELDRLMRAEGLQA